MTADSLRAALGMIEAKLLDAYRHDDAETLRRLCERQAAAARKAIADSLIEEASDRAAPILEEAFDAMERRQP